MLQALFHWLDANPRSYWILVSLPTAILLGWTAGLIRTRSGPAEVRTRETLFALLMLAVLFAWRWPFLLNTTEYNPDESQLIAGGLTLRVDPVPWRSLDGSTSGPLNFYPLLAIRLLGLPLNYLTARLEALLMIWVALVACYRWLRLSFEPAIARLAILPVLAFFCTVTERDFVHHSTEHLSLCLAAFAVLAIGPMAGARRSDRAQILGCFIAGLLPWTKLQSGPIAAVLVAAACFSTLANNALPWAQRWRGCLPRLAAAATPSLLILLTVILTGQFEHFLRSYFRQSFAYVGSGVPLDATASGLWLMGQVTGEYPYYLSISVAGALLGAFIARRSPPWRGFFAFGAAMTVAAAVSVLTPHRPFLHYVLLSVVPLATWMGPMLGNAWDALSGPKPREWLAFAILTLGSVMPFGIRTLQPEPEIFGDFASDWEQPHTVLGDLIRSYASPDARLAIWGWLPNLYVESGLPQGTRDGNTAWTIIPSLQREYYRARFLADLERNKPVLFVDAVGASTPFFNDREVDGHDAFPPLAAYVRQHYSLVTDLGYARLYAAKGAKPVHVQNQRLLLALSHPTEISPLEKVSTSPKSLKPVWTKTGLVQGMRPPAEIAWQLDASTREIVFEYGMNSSAYLRGGGTDGVDLTFELQSDGAPPRPVFHRFLDPVNRLADRGHLTSRIALPAFPPGTRLVVRTGPGPRHDDAWDWLYLGPVIPVHEPGQAPSQFNLE
jgi:hypothetical protein